MSIRVVREYTYKGWDPHNYELIDSSGNRETMMRLARKLSHMRKAVIVQRGLGGKIWNVWVEN